MCPRSGTAPGQTTAFNLLVHGATLAVVGFTMYVATDKLTTSDNFSPDPATVAAAGGQTQQAEETTEETTTDG